MAIQTPATTWSPRCARCGRAVAMLVLGWVLGGGTNAAIAVESLQSIHQRAMGRRTTGSRRRLGGVATLLGALALAGCGSTAATPVTAVSPAMAAGGQVTPPAQTPGAVPAQYQSQYTTIAAQTQTLQTMAGNPSGGASTTIGAELLAANGNVGTGLLASHAIAGVEAELNAYQALGVQGVTVCVSFPLLLPGTPNSSGYLSFYEQVAQQVRARDMILSVEENPVFAGTPLTSLPISYAGLTLDSYATEERQEAQIIIDDMDPAYLSLLTEPDTYTSVLRVDLDTPAAASQVVTEELSGLNRGTTLVGAGSGTWSSPAIDRALLTTSIDYLDVHVYPEAPADLTNLTVDVSASETAGKPLVMDETWLYKDYTNGSFDSAGSSQPGVDGAPNEMKDVSFSFWEPLDETYVTAMVNYVRSQGFRYVAFFDGARCFFGYLPWSSQLQADSYQAFSQEYNQTVSADMSSQTVSTTGLSLQRAIAAA
jgi:hypothetical protein